MGLQKLYVILGRKAAVAVFRQRKAHKADKESSLSFRFVALRALGLLSRRPQNDLDNKSSIVFVNLFVCRNTKTHFALCKSFCGVKGNFFQKVPLAFPCKQKILFFRKRTGFFIKR